MAMKDRKGIFRIDGNFVRECSQDVKTIMGMCSIWRAEYLLMEDVVEYAAICEKFDELDEGCIVPNYKWVISEDGCYPVKEQF